MEFYSDGSVMFEAFKAGEIMTHREFNAEKWATQFDFPAVQSGDVVLSEIPNDRPSGLTGFVMNTRNPIFQLACASGHDRGVQFRVHQRDDDRRTIASSASGGSVLGMSTGPAEGRVAELLEPFKADLLPGVLEGYTLPVSDGLSGTARVSGTPRASRGSGLDCGWRRRFAQR